MPRKPVTAFLAMSLSAFVGPVAFFMAAILTVGFSSRLEAEPSINDLKEIDDPLVVEALSCDVGLQMPDMADQKRAEEVYLEYIKSHPDSPVIPYIYLRLAYSYGCWVTKEKKEKGAVRNHIVARGYFQKAMETWPEGKLGHGYLDAWVNVAALAQTPEEKVREYIRHYAFLDGLRRETVEQSVWLTERQLRRLDDMPDYKNRFVDSLMRGIPGRQTIAAHNMVYAAGSDAAARYDLLGEIVEAFPDKEPGELARKRIMKLQERQVERLLAPQVDAILADRTAMGDGSAKDHVEELSEQDEDAVTAASEGASEVANSTNGSGRKIAYLLVTTLAVAIVGALGVGRMRRRRKKPRES